MRKVEITEKAVESAKAYALDNGLESVEKVLDILFPDIAALNGDGGCRLRRTKPTLDDYKTIKTYEDACEALDEKPWLNQIPMACYDDTAEKTAYDNLPAHIVALMKLETISKALWGRKFQPSPDTSGDKWYYYPWFALYTQKEIDEMSDKDRGALLSAGAAAGAGAGFGCLAAASRSSCSAAGVGFRLCQESSEKAEYFGKQFINLWAEYLKFNFEVQPK